MAKLRPDGIHDDRPVKVTIEIPAAVHRDLTAYADVLGRETGQQVSNPEKLIVPMLTRFMATDRAFLKARRRAAAADKTKSYSSPSNPA